MNLYLRYFDREVFVSNADQAIDFLKSIPEISVDADLEADIREYAASDVCYPKRYKVRPRVYFIVIKTAAANMQDFKDKKAVYYTLGCKLNFAETSAIGRSLLEAGFQRAKMGENADICIINTCSVTDTADKKCRQAINKLIHRHPNALIVVTGCYAQLKPDEITQMPGVDLVLGTNEKSALPDFITQLEKKTKRRITYRKNS